MRWPFIIFMHRHARCLYSSSWKSNGRDGFSFSGHGEKYYFVFLTHEAYKAIMGRVESL